MGNIRRVFHRMNQSYTDFIEKRGLGLVITACIAVIVGSAVWTHANMPAEPVKPEFPEVDSRSAAELMQESLADVVMPTPVTTAVPAVFQPPVSNVSVIRSFDAVRLQQSPVTGIWSLHDAVDILVTHGEQIKSIAAGSVISVTDDDLHGVTVIIDHSSVIASYQGLLSAAGLQAGDPVSVGQTIGFGGSGMADESDEPHLHLHVTQNQQPIDPLTLWNNQE